MEELCFAFHAVAWGKNLCTCVWRWIGELQLSCVGACVGACVCASGGVMLLLLLCCCCCCAAAAAVLLLLLLPDNTHRVGRGCEASSRIDRCDGVNPECEHKKLCSEERTKTVGIRD